MLKIAWRGFYGRRRANLQLLIIALLSFLFITSGILVYFNLENHKEAHLRSLYGDFENVYINQSDDFHNSLKSDPLISKVHRSKFAGASSQLGNLYGYTPELAQDLKLKLLAGRMPEKPGEIVLEAPQLAKFDRQTKLGDTIKSEIEHTVFNKEKDRLLMILPWDLKFSHKDIAAIAKAVPLEEKEILKKYFGWKDAEKDFYSYIKADPQKAFFEPEYTRSSQRKILPTKEVSFVDETFYSVEIFPDPIGVVNEEIGFQSAWRPRSYPFVDGLETSGPEEPTPLLMETPQWSKRAITVYSEFKVVGILESFSKDLPMEADSKPNSFTAPATIKAIDESFQEAFALAKETPPSGYAYFIQSRDGSESYYETHQKTPGLFRNALSYPTKKMTPQNVISLALLVFIYLQTLLSLAQIFLIQFKKRQRNLALFKAIGASNGQVRKLLWLELFFIILLALPLGSILGYFAARLIIKFYAMTNHTRLAFAIPWQPLLIGLASAAVICMIGIIYPLLRVKDIPLTGNLRASDEKNKNRQRNRISKLRPKPMTLRNVLSRHNTYHRRRSLTSFLLYGIIITSLLLSSLLSFLAFIPYREQVIETNKPDVVLKDRAALGELTSSLVKKKLRAMPEIKHFEILNFVFETFQPMDPKAVSPLQQALDKATPVAYTRLTRYVDHYTEALNRRHALKRLPPVIFMEGKATPNLTLMEVQPTSPILDILKKSSLNLNYNHQLFLTGEQAFLLYPRVQMKEPIPGSYQHEDALKDLRHDEARSQILEDMKLAKASYLKRYEKILPLEASMAQLKKIEIRQKVNSIDLEKVSPYPFFDIAEVRVAGFIPTLQEGIWPISRTGDFPILIGSPELIKRFSFSGFSTRQMIQKIKHRQDLPALGQTQTNIHLTPEAKKNPQAILAKLKEMEEFGLTLTDYTAENQSMLASAQTLALSFWLFAIILSLLSFQIQFNALRSAADQERDYVGILQSLGVSNRSLSRRYTLGYVRIGLVALLTGLVVFALTFLGYAAFKYGWPAVSNFPETILKNELAGFDWSTFLLACLIFLIFVVILSYLPIRRTLKQQPIENIRGLKTTKRTKARQLQPSPQTAGKEPNRRL